MVVTLAGKEIWLLIPSSSMVTTTTATTVVADVMAMSVDISPDAAAVVQVPSYQISNHHHLQRCTTVLATVHHTTVVVTSYPAIA